MRSDQIRLLLLALFVSTVVPSAASAQTAWRRSHTAGQPLIVFSTPPLTGGQRYWIETGGPNLGDDIPSPGDTVATLRTNFGPLGTNLGGADGCSNRGFWRASCFYVDVPSSYTTPTSFWLIVRPYSTAAAGVTSIRIQQGGGLSPVNVGCPSSTIQNGCWATVASNLSFGAAVNSIGSTSNYYHFETRERPGTTTTYQMIGFAPTAASWDIVVGAISNHSNLVGGTAEYMAALPGAIPNTTSVTVFAGQFGAGLSTLDLVRNDRGVVGGVTFGTDQDGDGLGNSLEGVLQTCDSPTSPAYCAGLRGCASPLSTLCLASRRDSDQDGYEDSLEFYGYQNGIDNLSNIARFGADPAQYDVFLELDSADATDKQDGTACSYGDDNFMDMYEGAQLAATFGASSAVPGGFTNPNGTQGITTHVDIPPRPSLALSPAPAYDNPRVGIWGGASCVSTPTCTSDANCMFGGVAGVCGAVLPGNTFRYCSAMNTLAAYQTNQRRWLFRHGLFLDSTPTGSGAGQGGSASGYYEFFAGGAAASTHELGHLGTLTHSGPAQNFYAEQNFNPVMMTTMNYRNSYVGYWEVVTGGALPLPAIQTLWAGYLDTVALAAPSTISDPTSVVERCTPLISSAQQSTLVASGTLGFYSEFVSGCVNVDWDRDGSIRPSGQTTTIHNAFVGEEYRRQRYVTGGVSWRRMHRTAEIVTAGTTRRLIRNEFVSPSLVAEGSLRMSTSTTFSCTTTPQASPADRYPPCDFASAAPISLKDGATAIATRNFAACDIANPGAAGDTALVVWQVVGSSQLRWGRLDPSATDTLTSSGNVGGSAARTTGDDTVLLGLARTTSGAVLVYRNSSGALVEQALTWTGTTANWSAPASLSSPIWTGMNGSAGLSHVYGSSDLTAGAYMAVQVGTTLSIYRRTGAAAWTSLSTVSTPAAVLGQPVIEIGNPWPHAGTPRRRVNLFARFANAWPVQVRDSDLSATTFAGARMPGWQPFDNGARTMATTAISVESQITPAGLRAADYDMVGDALVLNVSMNGAAPVTSCPSGSTATAVGSRSICFAGVQPVLGDLSVGVIDCGSSASVAWATDGVCPSGFTCSSAAAGRSYCTINGFVPMLEQRAPFADGVIQTRIEQQNEWTQMRHGFCRTSRELRTASFTPAVYQYPQGGLPGIAAPDVCTVAPTY